MRHNKKLAGDDMRQLPKAILLITMLANAGCGTIVMRGASTRGELYPATKGDVGMIHVCLHPDGIVFKRKSYIGAALTMVDIPISVTTDTILLPADLLSRHDMNRNRERARSDAMDANVAAIVAEIRQSPSLVYERQWHMSTNPVIAKALGSAMSDTNIAFTAQMLERLLAESPGTRKAVLAHPLCPAHILVENFADAYDKASAVSYETLAIIVSNHNTPYELVEKVASSPTMPVGAVRPALRELTRRKREQNGQQSLPPVSGTLGTPAAYAPVAPRIPEQ